MRYLKRKMQKKNKDDDQLLNKWEINFLLTLIILLVMATIVDLNISVGQILNVFL